MKALFLCVVVVVTSTGSALEINVTATQKQVTEGSSAEIKCREEAGDAEKVGGQVTHLVIEKVTEREVVREEPQYLGSDYYRRVPVLEVIMAPVVSLSSAGEVIWGEGYTDLSRVSVSGVVEANRSSLSLVINRTLCTDGGDFVCVARGDQATLDSKRHGLSVVALPGHVVITGGGDCPLALHQSRDHCDLYTRIGSEIELICKARIGQPLFSNSVSWYRQSDSKKEELKDSKTLLTNSSTDMCSGEVTSSLRYNFNPTDEDDEIIKCSVTFSTEIGEFSSSGKITICSEIPEIATASYTRDHIIGIFFAGLGTMLVILILILLVMCCCGCRLGVKRKHHVNISDSYPEK